MQPVADAVSVLVVDDNAGFRAAARALVDGADGFCLAGEAETGEQAVTLAAAAHPSLVLMDVRLPGMDGIEATRQLLVVVPEAVVVLCSTSRPEDLPAAVATCGAAGYIGKGDLSVVSLRSLWKALSGA